MSNWIDCSVQQPTESGDYLYWAAELPDACVSHYVAHFDLSEGWTVEVYDRIYEWGNEPLKATHWQPLPPGPRP